MGKEIGVPAHSAGGLAGTRARLLRYYAAGAGGVLKPPNLPLNARGPLWAVLFGKKTVRLETSFPRKRCER